MKKSFLLALLAVALLPGYASAKEIVKLTRFQGEHISGISASGIFEVKLVKALDPGTTRAIVELDIELEPYLEFDKKSDGTVEIGMKNLPPELDQKIRNTKRSDITMKLTLYLLELDYVSLSGAATLWTLEERDYIFRGESLTVKTSGAASLKSLFVDATSVDIDCSGASFVRLKTRPERVTILANGSAGMDIRSYGAEYTKITANGASNVSIRGDAVESALNGSGSARIRGDEFKCQDAVVSSNGAAQINLSVSNNLRAAASGSSSIRYKGNPRQMNASNSGAGSVKSL